MNNMNKIPPATKLDGTSPEKKKQTIIRFRHSSKIETCNQKSDANKVLRSGWSVFLVVALLVSVTLDIANPGVDLPSGTRFNFVRGGSAILGWLTVVIIFISPAYLLRAFGVAPINRWFAAFLCFVGVFVWVGLHTSIESNSRSHFNYTMWGCVISAWRLLTIPRITAREDKDIKLGEPDEVDDSRITKIETQTDTMGGRSEKYATEASQNLNHAEPLKISSHKKERIIGGLLIILLTFSVYAFVEDESPNLSWSLISCGIWASLAYLSPDKWFHFPRLQVNWKKVRVWAGYALLVTAIIAGLVLLMKALERSVGKSISHSTGFEFPEHADENPVGWLVVKIEGRDYVTTESISSFYKFASASIEGSNICLRSNNLILKATIGSQEILINNIKIFLSYPVVKSDGRALFSRMDLCKTIDPVLRPTYITDYESFDTVILDPAHGGEDEGSTSEFGKAKDMTLKFAQELRLKLVQKGFKVILTRSDDSFLTDDERIKTVNEIKGGILISLHFKSGDKQTSGIETLVVTPQGSSDSYEHEDVYNANGLPGNAHDSSNIALATAVHAMVISRFNLVDRGIKRSHSRVLADCRHPGILFNGGFITHPEEGRLIASDNYRQSVSSAIADAIVNYRTAMRAATTSK
jgi:N-acetylmuramoyl-L-alanine amidase